MAVVAVLCAGLAGSFLFRAASLWVKGKKNERRARESVLAAADAPEPSRLSGVFRKKGARRRAKAQRRIAVERHVPEMVDSIALGMRAGLSFEHAFGLYCDRFDDELALACRKACRSWESGLVSRDEALRSMAVSENVASLTSFVNNATRCLRFGSPMTHVLDVMADEARSCYRAKMEELVAKAPVKMLMPTAALILPAMLIVVMGPVLLEFL